MNWREIKKLLRLRLSEVEEGFFSDEELRLFFNEAQAVAADKISTSEFPWSAIQYCKIPCVSGAEHYLLPSNYLYMRRIAHYKKGYQKPCMLHRGDVSMLKFNSSEYSGRLFYTHYEVSSRNSAFIETGVAEFASDTLLVDTRSSFSQVRTGDIVHNLSDKSTAVVGTVAVNRIEVNDWEGGSSQAFQLGDEYRIQQRETTRWQLSIHPQITFSDPTFYSGDPIFKLEADNRCIGIEFNIQELPKLPAITELELPTGPTGLTGLTDLSESEREWQPDDRLNIFVETADGLSLASTEPESIFTDVGVKLGINKIDIPAINLHQNTSYRVRAEAPESSVPVPLSQISLFSENEDFLRMAYVPSPQPMIDDTTLCEFSDRVISVVLTYAQMRGEEKKDPKSMLINELHNRFLIGCEEIKNENTLRDEEGPDIVSNGMSLYNRAEIPGFTSRYGDVW